MSKLFCAPRHCESRTSRRRFNASAKYPGWFDDAGDQRSSGVTPVTLARIRCDRRSVYFVGWIGLVIMDILLRVFSG